MSSSFWTNPQVSLPAFGLLAGFFAVAIWESFRPLRTPLLPTWRRWLAHGVVWFVNNFAALFIVQLGAVYFAAAKSGWSFDRQNWPLVALRILLFFLLLDFLRFVEHYLFHRIPVLWRLHQVHHADADFDVSTALRFHPLQTALDQIGLLVTIAVFGPPPEAVFAFAVAGSVQDMFVHANVSSSRLERVLRPFLITPNMHRLHHSIEIGEQNLNFGFVFSWWDRMFRTFRSGSGDVYPVGLEGYQDARSMSVWRMMAMPVWGGPAESAPETPETREMASASAVVNDRAI